MPATKPSNSELARLIKQLDSKLDRYMSSTDDTLDKLNTFMITQQAREGYVRKADGRIDGVKLFKQILAVLTAFFVTAGAAISLIQAFTK